MVISKLLDPWNWHQIVLIAPQSCSWQRPGPVTWWAPCRSRAAFSAERELRVIWAGARGTGKQKVDQPEAGGGVQWPVLLIVWQLNSQNSDPSLSLCYICVKHFIQRATLHKMRTPIQPSPKYPNTVHTIEQSWSCGWSVLMNIL